jgi:uncharacterized protein
MSDAGMSQTDSSPSSFVQAQAKLANHLRDPEHHQAPAAIEDRRLKIYRDLIFNNVESFISGGFPILRQLYTEDAWHQLVRDFMASHSCHSPYFLEISEEFLTYLREERGNQAGDPPFMLELAHYEWAELALDVSTESFEGYPHTDDLMAGCPKVSPLAWTLSYQYPVHMIGPDYQPAEPPEQPTFLIVFRDRSDQVGFMESNAVTARLLGLLSADQNVTGEAALLQLADEMQHPDPQQLLGFGADLLEKLQRSDILC